MARDTIDFGIDLGTTNSAISVLNGVSTEIIKNNDDQETTPSAVWLDRRQRRYVGKAARERSELDPENTAVEFKLRMGTVGQAKAFTASGASMTPEQLSAEVLKSLRRDVAQRYDEEIDAAVITVPAAFDLHALDATRRAAELAGLSHAPLLQEPIAAALAHGFQATADNVFWLVYDFGGGTFDAAVVHLRDGEFTVVNHSGDNFLGGKLIDWKIVESLLIPEVTAQGRFTGLARGNARWLAAIAKLKLAAEAAKVRLSRAETTELLVELQDEDSQLFEFEYELTRAQVELIAEPFIERSVNLCRRALTERDLLPADVEKVLLVGGPTLSPYLRERLADRQAGLGIPLDHTLDPITAVARGAAIFAGTQRREAPVAAPAPGQYAVELEYQRVGPDTEPFIGGQVTGGDVTGWTVEIVNAGARPAWRSGRIPLGADGIFTAQLWAEASRANTFRIELSDGAGAPRSVTPETFGYTVGIVPTKPPLTHSIGVGTADNKVMWLVRRQTPLPTRSQARLRTTVELRQGERQGLLRIPIVEGEHERADRNRRVGRIEITPDQIRRNVPEGSEVDFTIAIDESRLVVARAYLPILDEEFEHVVNLQTEEVPSSESLAREISSEKHRLAAAQRRADQHGDAQALATLHQVESERTVEDIDALVRAAEADPDAAITADRRMRDLRAAIDEAEDALEWPQLVTEAQQLLAEAQEIVGTRGDVAQQEALQAAEQALRDALTAHDAGLLRQRLENLEGVIMRTLDSTGELPVELFEQLKAMRPDMTDPDAAERLIAAGEHAAASGDIGTLRAINAQLYRLVPRKPQPGTGQQSTVIQSHRRGLPGSQ